MGGKRDRRLVKGHENRFIGTNFTRGEKKRDVSPPAQKTKKEKGG